MRHNWNEIEGAGITIKTTPIKCLLCYDEAVVVIHAPNGCTCSINKIQPRCGHHLMRATDTQEEFAIIEDFRITNEAEINKEN